MPKCPGNTCPASRPYNAARESIDAWHVVISGFTQRLARPCGCQQLWARLGRNFDDARTRVVLFPWNADWAGVAEWIWRFRPLDRAPRVKIYAYSWGGGWGFPRLAWELMDRGIDVDRAVLADAVYRPPIAALAWLALTPWPTIRVPENVRRVDWFFQRQDRWPHPRGHLVAPCRGNGRTLVMPGAELRCTHHYMDDRAEWWDRCLAAAEYAPRDEASAPLRVLNPEP